MSTALLLPALDAHDGASVGEQLQAALVELVDLSLYGKQLHWSVVDPSGPCTYSSTSSSIRGVTSATPSPSVPSPGRFPDGQAGAVAAAGTIPPVDPGAIDDREVVRSLANRLAFVCERMRARMNALGELDVASQDVLVGTVRALEQQLWMVRAQLPTGSG